MLTLVKTTLAAGALSVLATVGSAATLGLTTSGASVTADDASLEYFDLGGGEAGLTGFFDVTGAMGVTLDGPGEVFVDATFLTAAPNDAGFGTLDISDDLGAVVEGDLVGFGFTDSTLEMLFDVFAGRLAGDFGNQVLLEFTLEPGSGLTFLGGLSDGDIVFGSATVAGNIAPIPLPAGLPLMGAGLAGLWVLRRRARA